jgi:hypothetical protein
MDDNYRLLPDKPLGYDENTPDAVLFGYNDLADSLLATIKHAPTPFTIGLFGKWGTGKSTVINLLKTKIDSKTHKIVIYDAWKYEKDDLRRTFLLEVADKLYSKSKIKELKTKLYFDEQITSSRWSPKNIRNLIILFILTFVIFYVFQKTITYTLTGKIDADTNKAQFANSFLVGAAAAFWKLLSYDAFFNNVNRTRKRLMSPEEFEEEFKNLLKKLPRNKDLVVVIDNLDRVQKDKVLNVLGTVKTFLSSDTSSDRVVFVIVSNDDVISRQLEPTKDAQNGPGLDLLSKYFNSIIRIPPFIGVEMGEYIEKQLDSTNLGILKDNARAAEMIAYIYRNNPREIKQFINSLVSYLQLAYIRAESQDSQFDANLITDNINFIVKLLLAAECYKSDYELIKEKTLNKALTWQEIKLDLQQSKGQFNSLNNTFPVEPTIENISVLITLRRSETEHDVPGWDGFEGALLEANIDTLQNYMQKQKSNDAFYKKLTDQINAVSQTPEKFSIVYKSIVGAISQGEVIDVESKAAINALNALAKGMPEDPEQLYNVLAGTDLTYFFTTCFPKVYSHYKNSFRMKLFNLLRSGNRTNANKTSEYLQLIRQIANNPELEGKHKETVSEIISTQYPTMEFIKVLVDANRKDYFENVNLVSNFMGSIERTDLNDLDTVAKAVSYSDLSQIDFNMVVNQLIKLISSSVFETDLNVQTQLSDLAAEIFDNYIEQTSGLADKSIYQPLVTRLVSVFNRIGEDEAGWTRKAKMINVLVALYRVPGLPEANQVHDVILRTFDLGHKSAFDQISSSTWNNLPAEFYTNVTNGLTSDPKKVDAVLQKNPKIELVSRVARQLLTHFTNYGDTTKKSDILGQITKLLNYVKSQKMIKHDDQLIIDAIEALKVIKALDQTKFEDILKDSSYLTPGQQKNL